MSDGIFVIFANFAPASRWFSVMALVLPVDPKNNPCIASLEYASLFEVEHGRLYLPDIFRFIPLPFRFRPRFRFRPTCVPLLSTCIPLSSPLAFRFRSACIPLVYRQVPSLGPVGNPQKKNLPFWP